MKASWLIVGVLTGVMLTAQWVFAQEATVTRQGRYYVEETKATYTVSPGGTLFLGSPAGSISIESWDKNEVYVVAEKRSDESREDYAHEDFEDIKIEMEQIGTDVRVQVRTFRERRFRYMPLRFTVTVPQVYNLDLETEGGSIDIGDLEGAVQARTSGGSIDIGKITGGKVEARTAGGSIDIREGGGDVVAETAGGSISIRRAGGSVEARTAGGSIDIGPTGGDIRARTAGGSIRLEESGGRVRANTAGGSIRVDGSNGPVEVETAGGSIDIENARGAIDAETAGGSVEAELIVSDKNIDTTCNLQTAGGDVTIYLLEDLAATIDAEIRIHDNDHGRRYRDYQIYSDFDINIGDGDGEEDDRRGRDSWRVTASGDINGGGDRIRLTTTNGDIHIRKLRP